MNNKISNPKTEVPKGKALNDKDYDYVTYYLDDTYLKYFFDNDKEKTKESK